MTTMREIVQANPEILRHRLATGLLESFEITVDRFGPIEAAYRSLKSLSVPEAVARGVVARRILAEYGETITEDFREFLTEFSRLVRHA